MARTLTDWARLIYNKLQDGVPVTGAGGGVALPSTLFSGYLELDVTEQTLPDHTLAAGVHLKLDAFADAPAFLGVSGLIADESYALYPGDSVFLAIDNTNKVYALSPLGAYGSGSARLYWMAS